MSVCLQWIFYIRLGGYRSDWRLTFLGCFRKLCNNLQNVVAITYIFTLQQPTFQVCNFLHFYFTINTSAYLGGIEYLPDRNLDKDLFATLRTNEYFRKGLNVMLIGATGCGKTYVACALATNACRNEYRARYYRLSEFFGDMEAARLQGKYNDVINQLRGIPRMIFDDFLLIPTTQDEQRDLFILLRARDEAKVSTILCSQVSIAGWHERLGSGGVADTLLDRMTANGYAITIGGDISMRKRHSRI